MAERPIEVHKFGGTSLGDAERIAAAAGLAAAAAGGHGPRPEARAFAPATCANLGVAFDLVGLALAGPGDTVTARFSRGTGVRLGRVAGDGGRLPRDAAANCAGIAAAATLRAAGVDVGVELDLDKATPIAAGLGGSAASAAAAAAAVNFLLGAPLLRGQLLAPCLEAETAVAGRHADNVAAAVLGGLVLVRSLDPLEVVRLPAPPGLLLAVATPDFALPTRRARAVLPRRVTLASRVRAAADVATFVSACYSGDLGLLGRAVREDEEVTAARAALIPGSAAVLAAARAAGALAASISGAGPSLFAFCPSPAVARRAGAAMAAAFRDAGLAASVLISPADCPGVRKV
jgi:homoserine kinase